MNFTIWQLNLDQKMNIALETGDMLGYDLNPFEANGVPFFVWMKGHTEVFHSYDEELTYNWMIRKGIQDGIIEHESVNLFDPQDLPLMADRNSA